MVTDEPQYEDIRYEIHDRVATITVNRPDSLNALRTQTYVELIDAIHRAGWRRTSASSS